jgi:hypothetical protein
MSLFSPQSTRFFIILATLLSVLNAGALASRGVVTKPADILLDGVIVGNVSVGQTVVILGQNDETGELLVSVGGGEQPIVGLIPGDTILDKADIPTISQGARGDGKKADRVSENAKQSSDSDDPFSPSRVWSAAELSEFMRDNRERFSEFKGKKIVVSGIISEARAEGRGEKIKMTVSLQTPPTMPRIKVEMSPSYLVGQKFRERYEFEKHHSSYTPTINFRNSRDGVSAQISWEYKSTYTSSGRRTYEYGYKKESAWIPVVTNNASTTISAVLSEHRFEIVLTDGEFVD